MKDPLEMYTDAGILASLSEMANRARIHEPYVEVPSQLVTSIGMRFEKMMRELERLQSESAWQQEYLDWYQKECGDQTTTEAFIKARKEIDKKYVLPPPAPDAEVK